MFTLHYITLHYITLHYITVEYAEVHKGEPHLTSKYQMPQSTTFLPYDMLYLYALESSRKPA